MEKDSERPQINASMLRVGGEFVGALFAVGSMLIFLLGIPLLRYAFPAAIVVGCLLALVLRFVRRESPGQPWLLDATECKAESPSRPRTESTSDRCTRIVIVPIADPI